MRRQRTAHNKTYFQCTVHIERVGVLLFFCFFLLLQIFAISKMHLKWARCRSCAVLCCAQCVVSKVVVALTNKHFHKLRISIQVYTLFENMRRVDFCHFIHSTWWLLVCLFPAWMLCIQTMLWYISGNIIQFN